MFAVAVLIGMCNGAHISCFGTVGEHDRVDANFDDEVLECLYIHMTAQLVLVHTHDSTISYVQ